MTNGALVVFSIRKYIFPLKTIIQTPGVLGFVVMVVEAGIIDGGWFIVMWQVVCGVGGSGDNSNGMLAVNHQQCDTHLLVVAVEYM